VVVKIGYLTFTTFITSTTFFNFKKLFFQNKPIDQFPDNPRQEHDDSYRIDNMHHLQVKTGGPVWIFLSEKIHEQI
jgi:hypothetical protein